jgi:uncharacterized membrane protein
MSRHAIAATLAALALVSILTPAVASARNLGPVGLAVGDASATPSTHSPVGARHYYPNYGNGGFVAPFGLGTGGFGTGGPGGCPPSICGHQHPQDR